MGVCLEVQFTPLEFEGFVRHLSSFLDVLEESGRHYGNVGSLSRGAFDSEVSFDDDGEVKLYCNAFLNESAYEMRDWSLGGNS